MKWAALGLAFAMPQAALALSCLRPDVATTYAEAVASEDTYSVLRGTLQFDDSLLPPAMNSSFTPPDPAPIPAVFTGAFLGDSGFHDGYSGPILLDVGCAGPWCGGATPGREYLLFARHDPAGLTVTLGACPFWAFDAPGEAQIARLLTCHTGGPCEPEQ